MEAGRLELLVNRDVLSEIRDVQLRSAVRKKFPLLSIELVDAFLYRIEKLATVTENAPRVFQFARDPDDEPSINLAIAGRAQYLVTRDRDLLDLAEKTSPEALQLRRVYPDLKILDPITLLREFVIARE